MSKTTNNITASSIDELLETYYESGDPSPLLGLVVAFGDVGSIVPTDVMTALGTAGFKHTKNIGIIRSTVAIVSVLFSFALIRMLLKSKRRLSITYHRLLFGMSIGDILFSLPYATFNITSPSDLNYVVWNARGNQASCSAQGFFTALGFFLTLGYSCSLNLYYLFKVKYNKTDSYIRTKIEPFLHGVPTVIAIIFSSLFLAMQNYNDSYSGVCSLTPKYQPIHCIGYEDGEVREGFTIPCGRGENEFFYGICGITATFLAPVIIGVSLGMLYRHVTQREAAMLRYAVGNTNGDDSNSRAVLHKALAYSTAYFLTWGWDIGGSIILLAGKGEVPPVYGYLWTIFSQLQGFFNLLVYMYPKAMFAKKSQDISLLRAFVVAFRAGLTGNELRKKSRAENKLNSSVSVETGIQLSTSHYKTSDDVEGEKTEVQSPLDDNSSKTLQKGMPHLLGKVAEENS